MDKAEQLYTSILNNPDIEKRLNIQKPRKNSGGGDLMNSLNESGSVLPEIGLIDVPILEDR